MVKLIKKEAKTKFLKLPPIETFTTKETLLTMQKCFKRKVIEVYIKSNVCEM